VCVCVCVTVCVCNGVCQSERESERLVVDKWVGNQQILQVHRSDNDIVLDDALAL